MTGRATARLLVVMAGFIVAAIVAVVPYVIWPPESRSETFDYSTAFAVFQVVVFFSGWGFLPGGFSVVRMGMGTVCAGYNMIALATLGAYHLVQPGVIPPRVFYAATVAETGLAVALGLLLGLVGIAHRDGNREAEGARVDVEDLRARASRLLARLASRGHRPQGRRLEDAIRFCEALRRDRGFAGEVHLRLAALEDAADSDTPLPDDIDLRITQLTALVEGNR